MNSYIIHANCNRKKEEHRQEEDKLVEIACGNNLPWW